MGEEQHILSFSGHSNQLVENYGKDFEKVLDKLHDFFYVVEVCFCLYPP